MDKELNPHGIVEGGVYRSLDAREGYRPGAFTVEKIDAQGYAHIWPVGKERPQYPKMTTLRRIRLDRMKPTGKGGYERLK